jgi:hypothetical protein
MRAPPIGRLRKLEAKLTAGNKSGSWVDEPYGAVRFWDLIVAAMDRFSYHQDPAWLKPVVYQDRKYAPTARLLEEYSAGAIEFAVTVCDAIVRVDTYRDAFDIAQKMTGHLPNLKHGQMGSRTISLGKCPEDTKVTIHHRGQTTNATTDAETKTAQ